MHLMVIADFDGRRRGDVIADAGTMADIQASPHAAYVVAVASDPATPGPAAPSIIIED